MSNSSESKTTSPVALWDRPRRRWTDKAAIGIGVAISAFALASCAVALKWWILSALALSALVLIGEEAIMSWLFFVSVVGGAVWLFFNFVMGIQL